MEWCEEGERGVVGTSECSRRGWGTSCAVLVDTFCANTIGTQ